MFVQKRILQSENPKMYSRSNDRRGFLPETDLVVKENMREAGQAGARKSFFSKQPKGKKVFF